jgi:SRSO17 transposase
MKTTSADVARWAYELIKLHARIAGRFARPEPHRRALKYLKGLMSQTERKNGWQLAEHAREANPYGMQRLLSRAVWDSDGVRDDVRDYVLEQLGDEQAIGVIDETSFLKQGDKSAGVAVQYCGSTGEVQNCQVAVFLAYVSPLGHALIDRELYLPQAWTQDRERCREAGIPDAVGFQTKPELAQTMLARLSQAGVVLSWVVADTVYGGNLELRSWLHAHGQAHVVAVPCNEPVGIQTPQGRQLVEVRQVEGLLLLASDWQRLSMSQGTKGPRIFDWACVPILHQWQDDGRHWLLIRRCVADPKQKAYYFVFGPSGTTLQEMVTAIGARWHVEEVFETAKDMGLDHYEVRTWTAWYRHITLVMLAHAFLTSICANARVSVPPPMLREEAPADCPCLYHQQQETPADSTLCKSPNSERRKLDPIVQSAQPHAVQAVLPLCNSPNSTRAEQTSLGAISPSTPPRIMQFPQPHEAQTVLPLCNSPNSKQTSHP